MDKLGLRVCFQAVWYWFYDRLLTKVRIQLHGEDLEEEIHEDGSWDGAFSHEERWERQDLFSMEQRKLRVYLIEVYKIMRGIDMVDIFVFPQSHSCFLESKYTYQIILSFRICFSLITKTSWWQSKTQSRLWQIVHYFLKILEHIFPNGSRWHWSKLGWVTLSTLLNLCQPQSPGRYGQFKDCEDLISIKLVQQISCFLHIQHEEPKWIE